MHLCYFLNETESFTYFLCTWFQLSGKVSEEPGQGEEDDDNDPPDDLVRYEPEVVIAEEYDHNTRFLFLLHHITDTSV